MFSFSRNRCITQDHLKRRKGLKKEKKKEQKREGESYLNVLPSRIMVNFFINVPS